MALLRVLPDDIGEIRVMDAAVADESAGIRPTALLFLHPRVFGSPHAGSLRQPFNDAATCQGLIFASTEVRDDAAVAGGLRAVLSVARWGERPRNVTNEPIDHATASEGSICTWVKVRYRWQLLFDDATANGSSQSDADVRRRRSSVGNVAVADCGLAGSELRDSKWRRPPAQSTTDSLLGKIWSGKSSIDVPCLSPVPKAEVSPTCDTELGAWSSALAHRIANSEIALYSC
ncbi:MAG: hypothetical protein ABL900_05600 [Burkholderiaceae bacterium]